MQKRYLLIIIAFLWPFIPVCAWDYKTTDNTSTQSVQLRIGAEYEKKWQNGISLSLDEDLRFDLYNSVVGTSFNRSYTTLTFAYSPIPYLKIDAGYTLKLLGTKDWSDANEFLRHRVFLSLTGSYKIQQWKISLRERAVCEIRTDSVNPFEKNQYNWLLRSRLGAEYSLRSKPIKPYAWVELINTLNVPEYQQRDGQQYISDIRAAIGVKWRITRHHSLNFYYRFNYGYNRDINITHKKSNIELTEERSYQNVIGVVYKFDH